MDYEKQANVYAIIDPKLRKIYGDTVICEIMPKSRPVGDGLYAFTQMQHIPLSCGHCCYAGLSVMCKHCLGRM